MIDVRRLGTAAFTSPDLGRMTDYFSEMIGLVPVERSAARTVLATAQGQEAIVLEHGAAASLARLSFQVAPATDLTEAAKTLNASGIASELANDPSPGVARALRFTGPDGMTIELFADYRFAPKNRGLKGIMPLKVGHAAFVAPAVDDLVKLYTKCLGFRVSDWRPGMAYFLRCNADHHTVNFFRNDKAQFHHLAFELNDWAELHRAADYLARSGYLLEWGPSRHIIGHNIACYHRNPDGILIELYTELDQMKDEALGYFDPRPWHEDTPQRPKAWPDGTPSNYWGTHQIFAHREDAHATMQKAS